MVVDQEFEPHRETWLGFARLLRWVIVAVVVVLVAMALFLL